MSYNEPRRQTSDVLLACEETQYRTSQELTPRALSPSAPGTMTTGTLTDANVGASFVGAYLIPEDGSVKDACRQAKARASTVLTVDSAWFVTTGVTTIRAWTPADVPVRATGSGSTTTVVSSPHAAIANEPAAYWAGKGYHLLAYGGQNAGKAAKITDSGVGGVYTFSPAVISTIADELWMCRKRLRPEGQVTANLTRKAVARSLVGYADAAPSVMVNYDGSIDFALPVRGVSAAAASAVAAVPPIEMSDLCSSIMTQTLDTGTTATGVGAANVLPVTSAAGLSVGGFVLLKTGEVAQIRSISGNNVTLGSSHIANANLIAVAAADVVYASAWFQRKTLDFRSFTFDYFRGGLFRQVFHGCMPTVSMKVTRDQVVTFGYKYMSGEAHEYKLATPVAANATAPITIIDTSVPFDAKGSRCLLNGTNVLLDNLTIDFGFKPELRHSQAGANQSDGYMMALVPIGGTFTILADEDDRAGFEAVVDLMNRSAAVDFLYQKGSAPGNTFAACIPAMQIDASPQKFVNGASEYEAKFIASLPQAVPANSFNALLPTLTIGWL